MRSLSRQQLRQYRQVRQRAAFIDRIGPGILRVDGADRNDFLHALLTQDVKSLQPLQNRYGALLTATGHLVSDFFLLRFPETTRLEIDRSRVSETLSALQRYVVMDDVQIRDESGAWRQLSLLGPWSRRIASRVLGEISAGPRHRILLPKSCGGGWLTVRPLYGEQGVQITVPEEQAAQLQNDLELALEEVGGTVLEPPVVELLRIEAGVPLFGAEIHPRSNPLEVGLQEAISYDKGCYVGQEVVSKATYVGGVSRRLVRFQMSGRTRVQPGSRLLWPEDRRVAGAVTSSVYSPRFGRTIGLALVRRSHDAPAQLILEGADKQAERAELVDSFQPVAISHERS